MQFKVPQFQTTQLQEIKKKLKQHFWNIHTIFPCRN